MPGTVVAPPGPSGHVTSRYKGVSWSKKVSNTKWTAQIQEDGKKTHLGIFNSEEEAARKYDEAAVRLGRPLNFPATGEEADIKKGTKAGGSSSYKVVSCSST